MQYYVHFDSQTHNSQAFLPVITQPAEFFRVDIRVYNTGKKQTLENEALQQNIRSFEKKGLAP
jgi:hypothetical protein